MPVADMMLIGCVTLHNSMLKSAMCSFVVTLCCIYDPAADISIGCQFVLQVQVRVAKLRMAHHLLSYLVCNSSLVNREERMERACMNFI